MVERGRGTLRAAAGWDVLRALVDEVGRARGGRPLRIVDLGGGTGGTAVPLALLGHQVTVVDPSPDALASLERRAVESDVAGAVQGVLGDAATLPDLVPASTIDVVVCHGVLEVVDDPVQAMAAAAGTLSAGGCLSVLAAQRSGAVLTQALAGRFDQALALLAAPDGPAADPPRYLRRADLESLVSGAGLTTTAVRGVGVFADRLDGVAGAAPSGSETDLRALEAAVATDPEYLPFATHLHLLAVSRRTGA